jgi:outer membrane protein OmpA-like peptidoglycan-associated protein
MAKDYLSPDVVKKFASHLGETPEATHKGLTTAIPAVVGGLADQASRDPSGAEVTRTLEMSKGEGDRIDRIQDPSSMVQDPSSMIVKGQRMVQSLFGEKTSSVVDQVARSSGLSQNSAGKVLALAGPIAGAVVGREAAARRVGPAGIASMLASHRGMVGSAFGAAGVASIFGRRGAGDVRPDVERAGGNARYRTGTPGGERIGRRVGMPLALLGIIALLAVLMLFARRRPVPSFRAPDTLRGAEAPRAPQAEAPPTPEPPTVAPPSAEEHPVTAPPAIGGGPSDAVSALNEFFADTSAPTPKSVALDVKFDHDSSRLGAASASSLDGIATALRAHPTAQVRIDGFTDDSGNDDHNKALSADRANAVRDALIRRGVDQNQIEILGNGAANPMASNDTPEGRAANRRIEMVVLKR